MISKAQIKVIRSLEYKKFRKEKGLFVAEGHKLVSDLATTFNCKHIFVANDSVAATACLPQAEIITRQQLEQLSLLRNPQDIVAVFETKEYNISDLKPDNDTLILALEDIQDPGNVGTIIRTADWFGIHDIVCSEHTADIYNPKVVQATMGALARVRVFYTDLRRWLDGIKNIPVYGTLLDGDNIYDTSLTRGGVILMGNEGNGLSADIQSYITSRLLIPSYPPMAATSESLNVSIATALVCSEFRRRTGQNPKAGD